MSSSPTTIAYYPNGSMASVDGSSPRTRHQEALKEYCNQCGWRAPVYSIVSDRRGGRTAWSSSVEVQGARFNARFWYDGAFVEQSKEDCAEVALRYFYGAAQQSSGED